MKKNKMEQKHAEQLKSADISAQWNKMRKNPSAFKTANLIIKIKPYTL